MPSKICAALTVLLAGCAGTGGQATDNLVHGLLGNQPLSRSLEGMSYTEIYNGVAWDRPYAIRRFPGGRYVLASGTSTRTIAAAGPPVETSRRLRTKSSAAGAMRCRTSSRAEAMKGSTATRALPSGLASCCGPSNSPRNSARWLSSSWVSNTMAKAACRAEPSARAASPSTMPRSA